ncbi:hypothetical protein CP97_11075 [Aurantiacibacter atlanticus]|uniref:Uncharacterized protein n=1 Tax=Aurantiacibacter atlanticus TaxID=1648404 RepID=A0A0H4VHG5_9SPHN|nr:hypothetical protein [Aurantiacibacter atlanticus]AKQ42454.1 hypothetical protein CP97_11075 [Aurantiacibacter atlanticus]MDF1834691.1 hypothetical protein [Alteraurantiacibacter sp. bin_em_oilr2.035]
MFDFIISAVILAAAALFAGAVYLHRKGNRKQSLLMAVLAVVMMVNVAIWIIPTEGGGSLAESAAKGEGG